MIFRRSISPAPTPAPRGPADYAALSARVEAQVSQEFYCECEETEIRCRQHGRGARQYVRQCTRCFKWGGTLPRSAVSAREAALALPLNVSAREAWEGQRRRYRERLLAEECASDSGQFWARYSDYLGSPEWAARRVKVLERDGYLCQGCLTVKATQAHHLTYEHVFNELLWELVAVCGSCHERLHAEAKAGGKGR